VADIEILLPLPKGKNIHHGQTFDSLLLQHIPAKIKNYIKYSQDVLERTSQPSQIWSE